MGYKKVLGLGNWVPFIRKNNLRRLKIWNLACFILKTVIPL